MRFPIGLVVVMLAACSDDPGAHLDIDDATASRDPSHKVVVDVVILARESLGGNIGNYCVSVLFPGATLVNQCARDLEDGDRKTVRFVSVGEVAGGSPIQITARLAATDVGRNLVTPP